ncbi:TPM domain-containing protein, partial [Verrucomicrobiota bacterium]
MFSYAKKWLLPLLLLASVLTAQASDKLINSLQPRGFVNDFANVIPQTQERQLEQLLVSLERQTGAEVAVVTLNSLDGGQIDDFAVRLYERWKLGKAGKDNGVMLLAAINDRKARIEVGYGLEGAIPDGRAGQILRDDIFPSFKRGQYGNGLIAGASSISERIAREYGVKLQSQATHTRYRQSGTRQARRRG